MAWCDIGNGPGNWISDDDSTVWLKDLRTALAELCYATNEREMLLGRGCIEDDGSTFPNGYVSPWASWTGSAALNYSELLTHWKCRHSDCAEAIGASDTTITVECGDNLPSSTPFFIYYKHSVPIYGTQDEYMKVTAKDGNELTVTRAQFGTYARNWGEDAIGRSIDYVTTFPSADDIDGFINHLVPLFIADLRQAIARCLYVTSLLPGWHVGPEFAAHYTTSDYSTLLTAAAARAAGSYGSSWVTANRVQNASIYLQIREVLEEMKYLVVYPEIDADIAVSHFEHRYGLEPGLYPDDAWAEALGATPAEVGFALVAPWAFFDETRHAVLYDKYTGVDGWEVYIYSNAQIGLLTQNLHGVYEESGVIRLRKWVYFLDDTVTLTIDGSITEDLVPGSGLTEVEKEAGAWLTPGEKTLLPFDIETPEVCPLTRDHIEVGKVSALLIASEWAGAEPAGVAEPCSRAYLDITSELTYG